MKNSLSHSEMTEGDIVRLNRMYKCPEFIEEEIAVGSNDARDEADDEMFNANVDSAVNEMAAMSDEEVAVETSLVELEDKTEENTALETQEDAITKPVSEMSSILKDALRKSMSIIMTEFQKQFKAAFKMFNIKP